MSSLAQQQVWGQASLETWFWHRRQNCRQASALPRFARRSQFTRQHNLRRERRGRYYHRTGLIGGTSCGIQLSLEAGICGVTTVMRLPLLHADQPAEMTVPSETAISLQAAMAGLLAIRSSGSRPPVYRLGPARLRRCRPRAFGIFA
jgi:hypothetical protein